MQQRQARTEAEQRLSVALGELGGRSDATVATAAAGASPTPVSVSSSSMMGCIDTRLLGKPDKFDGQDSCWRDWKFIAKAYIQAALPDIRVLLVKAEETSEDVRNVVLNALASSQCSTLLYAGTLDEEPCTGQSASSWRRRGSGSMAWSPGAVGAEVQEPLHQHVVGHLERQIQGRRTERHCVVGA